MRMVTTDKCLKCGEEMELSWERDTADDGEFYNVLRADCFAGCEFDGDDMDAIHKKCEITQEQIDDYLEGW